MVIFFSYLKEIRPKSKGCLLEQWDHKTSNPQAPPLCTRPSCCNDAVLFVDTARRHPSERGTKASPAPPALCVFGKQADIHPAPPDGGREPHTQPRGRAFVSGRPESERRGGEGRRNLPSCRSSTCQSPFGGEFGHFCPCEHRRQVSPPQPLPGPEGGFRRGEGVPLLLWASREQRRKAGVDLKRVPKGH